MRERRGQKVRIDLSGTDLRLIKLGLDLAVKRQKAVLNERGLQPGKGYNKSFAWTLRELHRTLDRNNGGEFYFDATQISGLKFALSETSRKLLRDKTAQRGKQKRPLVQELEMVAEKLQQVRKCAERERQLRHQAKQYMTSDGKDGRHLRYGCMTRLIKRRSSDKGPSQ